MEGEVVRFDWLEYTVFAGLLSTCALIGIYFGFIKGGQNTVDEYYLGGRNMHVLPISASMVCSYISGVTLLGTPTEIYRFGAQYMMSVLGMGCLGLVFAYVLLPIFYKLQAPSLYQYLELRFDSSVRKVVSFLYTVYLLLYIPIIIYGPGLAMNQGLNVLGVTSVLSIICIFYTSVGGLKAVVWTDTLQGGVMVLSSIIVAIVGTIHVGGWDAVFQAAREGDRLDLFNLDPDPRRRTTFWTMGIGVPIIFTGTAAINPSYMQRFLALPTMKKAQWSALIFSLGAYFFYFTSGYMGLLVYAKYKDCDPLRSGKISKPDQILPLFVAETAGSVRGLSGTFLAGIVCAALSSMSTGINTVAGTLYYDFLEGHFGKSTDRKTSFILKLLAGIFGVVCLCLVIVVERLEAILELTFSLHGISTGVIFGILLLGMFFPHANSKGAVGGGVLSMALMTWILLGSKAAQQSGLIVYERKPTSIAECPFNITTNSTIQEPSFGKAFPLFEISIFYFCGLGCILCIVIGLAVSFLLGPNRVEDVNRDLLSPLIHKYLPSYTPLPIREIELKDI